MMQRPSPLQQALTGVAVMVVVVGTVVGALLLASGDSPEGLLGEQIPSPTVYRLPTLPPATHTPTPFEYEDTPQASPSPTMTPTEVRATEEPPDDTAEPTRTPTRTPLPPSATPTTPTCQIRSGWVPYTVQRGETLYSIGLRYGLSTTAIREGNCLESSAIQSGQVIYVPPSPQPGTGTSVRPTLPTAPPPAPGGPTPTSTGGDGVCTTPDAYLSSPGVGAVLSGVAQFYGTATNPAFSFYKLELRQEGASTSQEFITFVTGTQPVVGGLLGEVDTRAFADGEYWVRMMVVDSGGNYPEPCTRLVVIDN